MKIRITKNQKWQLLKKLAGKYLLIDLNDYLKWREKYPQNFEGRVPIQDYLNMKFKQNIPGLHLTADDKLSFKIYDYGK